MEFTIEEAFSEQSNERESESSDDPQMTQRIILNDSPLDDS